MNIFSALYANEAIKTWMHDVFGPFLPVVEWIVNLTVILLAGKLLIWLGRYLIGLFFRRRMDKADQQGQNRLNTLRVLANHVWKFIVYFFMVAMVVDMLGLGVTAGSILATAGIGGVAIGFGAQSLVKDMFTGICILFENQFSVGDFVRIGGETGTVEDINLRTTVLKAATGETHVIPNGNIDKVTNYSRSEMLALVDMLVSRGQDLSRIESIMLSTCRKYAAEEPNIVAEPALSGPVQADDTGVTLRIVLTALPGSQYGIEREARKRMLTAFEAEGVKVPDKTALTITQSKE